MKCKKGFIAVGLFWLILCGNAIAVNSQQQQPVPGRRPLPSPPSNVPLLKQSKESVAVRVSAPPSPTPSEESAATSISSPPSPVSSDESAVTRVTRSPSPMPLPDALVLPSSPAFARTPSPRQKAVLFWPNEEVQQYQSATIIKARSVLQFLADNASMSVDDLLHAEDGRLERLDPKLEAFLQDLTASYASGFTASIKIDSTTKDIVRIKLIFQALVVMVAEKDLSFFSPEVIHGLTRMFIALSQEKDHRRSILLKDVAMYKEVAINCLQLFLEIISKKFMALTQLIKKYKQQLDTGDYWDERGVVVDLENAQQQIRLLNNELFFAYYHLTRLEYSSYAGSCFPESYVIMPHGVASEYKDLKSLLNITGTDDVDKTKSIIAGIHQASSVIFRDNDLSGFMKHFTDFLAVKPLRHEQANAANQGDEQTTSLVGKVERGQPLIKGDITHTIAYFNFALGLLMYRYGNFFIQIREVLQDKNNSNYTECVSFWATLINQIFYIQNELENRAFKKYRMRLHLSSVISLIFNFDFLEAKESFVPYQTYAASGKTSFSRTCYMLMILFLRKNIVECKNHDKTLSDTRRFLISSGITAATGAIVAGLSTATGGIGVVAAPLVAAGLGGVGAVVSAAAGGRGWDQTKELYSDLTKESSVVIREIKSETVQYVNDLCQNVEQTSQGNAEQVSGEIKMATLVFIARTRALAQKIKESDEKTQKALLKILMQPFSRSARTTSLQHMQANVAHMLESPLADEQDRDEESQRAVESQAEQKKDILLTVRREIAYHSNNLLHKIDDLENHIRLLEDKVNTLEESQRQLRAQQMVNAPAPLVRFSGSRRGLPNDVAHPQPLR